MSDPVEIPLDDQSEHIVDPPIVDLLYLEPATDGFVITFIPEDAVSKQRTEAVEIARSSEDGKRIALWLSQLGMQFKLPGAVEKVFHRGGGDFGFYGPNASEQYLSSPSLSSATSQQAYIALQDIAQTAQIAFLLSRRPPETAKSIRPVPVSVKLRSGHILRASAEGNNVSWLCICGYKLPLLGTTRPGAPDTRCPNCGRIYRVFPFPHAGAKIECVEEIEPAKATV